MTTSKTRQPSLDDIGKKTTLHLQGEDVEGIVSKVNENGTVSVKTGDRFYHQVRYGKGEGECAPPKKPKT